MIFLKKMSEEKFLITRNSLIGDVLREYPDAIEIFLDYGISCVGCHISEYETLEQGILGHGFTEEDLEGIIREIQEAEGAGTMDNEELKMKSGECS